MNFTTRILGVSALFLTIFASGCATQQATVSEKSLYERLGGKDAIVAVVDDFVGNVVADTRINKRFANSNAVRVKSQLVDFVCQGTGGPCKYVGNDMKTGHTGMNISEAEFNALVEDLVTTLDKFKVPAREKNVVLSLLGSMKGDIINR